jgi:hypothetical protein
MYYDNNHALIYASWHQQAPENSKIYINVDSILRRVRKVIETSRGLRAVTVTPEGVRRISINEDDLLVISYLALDGFEADRFIRSARIASLPLLSSLQQPYVCSESVASCYH